MRPSFPSLLLAAASASLLVGCPTVSVSRKANVLDYLYPAGVEAQAPADVTLNLPLRVGIAFAPSTDMRHEVRTDVHESVREDVSDDVFDEKSKRDLLERVAAAFRDLREIQSVEVLPTRDLRPGGGFANLDQVAAMYNLQVVALLSYEQVQFDEPNKSSITYWTLVGAYVIEGNRNETRTILDAAVFDLPSRTLLFRAEGSDDHKGSATALEIDQELRDASRKGFVRATDALIADLKSSLAVFREQAKTGHVRGPGTPGVSVTAAAGTGEGGSGAGALGGVEAALALLILGLCCVGGRRAA